MPINFRLWMISLCLVVLSGAVFSAPNDTPNYWQCANRAGGSWSFGRAPDICDFDLFVTPSLVVKTYSKHIFDDSEVQDFERLRYMDEMYASIKKMAEWYLDSRNPKASAEEKKYFVRAVMSMAHQESYWSHYRKTSKGRIQMMRGDYGHGHGLFQVDDRWHFNAVLDGRAANMIMNGLYSLDEYYAAWIKSATAKCIAKPTDYYNRARAAYSAYNGGPTKICRWTNPKDTWARNDVGFKAKLDGQSWSKFVTHPDLESDLDIACIAAGSETCGQSTTPKPEEKVEGLFAISTFIKLKKSINFRQTPNGTKLGVLATGARFQIIGIQGSDSGTGRYYQVISEGKSGFLYAGDNQSHLEWAIPTESAPLKYVFVSGDLIEVSAYDGIAYWIDSQLASDKIAWGERLVVKKIEVTSSLSLFYHVEWKGRGVKIDGGKLGDSIVLSKDLLEVDSSKPSVWGRLSDSIYYMNVRQLKSTSSKVVGQVAGPKTKEQLIKLLAQDGQWCQIQAAELLGYIKCHYFVKVSR